MLKNHFTFYFLLLIALISCSTDELHDSDVLNENVKFSMTIESSHPTSRVNTNIDGKGQFVEGDIITLNYNDEQKDLTFFNETWTPQLPWSAIPGQTVSFSAFYPNVEHNVNRFVHKVSLEQNISDNFNKSDLLFAEKVTVNKGEIVDLNFKHVLSCLTINLKSNIYTTDQLSNAVVQLKAYNEMDVYADGRLGKLYDYRHNVGNIPEITLKHKEGTTFQAIVCPQSVHELDYSQWWLRIKVGDKVINIKEAPSSFSNGTRFSAFEPGKNVTLNYSLNEKTADPVYGNKTIWVYGLKDMPDPNTDAWKVYARYKNVEFKHLPWNPKYGWYDVNKSDLLSEGRGFDSNLCWAASASNMLHWWLDRNREYIDRFCDLNNIPQTAIPQKFFDRNNSEVFNLYKQNFDNDGAWPEEGMKWYLWGEYDRRIEGAILYGDGGGYFKKVFNTNSNIIRVHGISTMEILNDVLKKALSKKEAIGFNIAFQGLPNGHALTLWGASFDEFGMVKEIYYCENNDGDFQTPAPHNGLLAARVGEYEGKLTNLKGSACIMNSIGETSLPIREMYFLNTGEEIWQNYFKQQSK